MSKRRPALSNANPAIAVRNWVGRKADADERVVGALLLAVAALKFAKESNDQEHLLGGRIRELLDVTDATRSLLCEAIENDYSRQLWHLREAAQRGDEGALARLNLLGESVAHPGDCA